MFLAVTLPLTCGHQVTVHQASSVFDFPEDPEFCTTCQGWSAIVWPIGALRFEEMHNITTYHPATLSGGYGKQ